MNYPEDSRYESPSRYYSDEGEPRSRAIFTANEYDLLALGALVSGIFLLLSCVTSNMIWYCLPFLPLLMGGIALASARQAVNEERTRLWAWMGLGTGVLVILFAALLVLCTIVGLGIVIYASGVQ